MADTGICSIPHCGKATVARGWCGPHYKRWRRHDDPLGGGTSRGELLRYFSEVVLAYRGEECLTWPYSRGGNGYGQVSIDGALAYVHRLACEYRHGPPPTPAHEAAHSCGRGREGCCNSQHLDWKTAKENQDDKLVHGTHNRGERNARSKLTARDVKEIRAIGGTMTRQKLAERFGVSRANICEIISGKRWAWLGEETGDGVDC